MSMRSRLFERARTVKHKTRERRATLLAIHRPNQPAGLADARWNAMESLEPRVLLSADPAPSPHPDPFDDPLGGVDALNTAVVEARHLFFNNSFFDSNTPGPHPDDDNALVAGKQALLPGVESSFDNYTNYARGINGVFVDISDIPDPQALDADDFQFNLGNNSDPSTWTPAPDPAFVDVRENAGQNGADRVTLIWNDGDILNNWLEIRVLPGDTGLSSTDLFYFGNAAGDTFNAQGNLFVDASDLAGIRDNPRTFLNRATVADPFDLNRDSFVDASDFAIARDNPTNFTNDVEPILVPFTAPEIEQLALVNDSGDANDDALTNDPAVSGIIQNTTGPITLRAGLNTDDENQFVDLSAVVEPDGSFTLDEPALRSLNADAPLPDGDYTLRFRALADGGSSDLASVSFSLDRTPPQLDVQTLAQGLNVNPTSRLQGSVETDADVTFQIGNGIETPLNFDPDTGAFDAPLPVAGLGVGLFDFLLRAVDPAGNVRLRQFGLNRTTFEVIAFSPDNGDTEVGATFRPKVFFGEPVNPNSLNSDNFFATAAGQKLDAAIVPANDGRFAWLFFNQPMPAAAMVEITVDGDSITSSTGATLDADGDGSPGGVLNFAFSTVNLSPVPNTTLTGVIADPGPDNLPFTADDVDPGPDGLFHTPDDVPLLPIEGVDVHLLGLEDHRVFTDADGRYTLDKVPAGNVKAVTDGMTALTPTPGYYFPEMVMDANMAPGVQNLIMPGHEIMFLPRVPDAILNTVENADGAMIVAGDDGAPELDPDDRQRLTIEVQPNSLTAPDGTPVDNADIGISTVPPELVVDMLPPGVLQHTFDITVQAPGVATFSDPAPMTFPNVFDAPPGSQLNFLSFDHTTGRLVIEGTATVSDDGQTVATDPGAGITTPGWHGVTPQGSNTGRRGDGRSANGDGDGDDQDDGPKDPAPVSVSGQNAFYNSAGNKQTIQITHTGNKNNHNPAHVTVSINGADAFLEGIDTSSYSFTLDPGDFEPFRLVVADRTDDDVKRLENAGLDGEILTGSIDIKATSRDMDGNSVTVADETYYLGRLLALDDNGLVIPESLETENNDDLGGSALELSPAAEFNEDGSIDLVVREKGPEAFDYALSGDDRLSLNKAADTLTFTFTPDPDDDSRPEADIDVSRQADPVGSAPLNAEPPLSLDPLALRVTDGEINKNDDGFDISGVVEIGLSDGPFEPLATLDGMFVINDQVIRADGSLTTNLGPLGEITLFNGSFEIPRGQAGSEDVQDDDSADEDDNGLSLAGLDVALSGITFENGALNIQGSVTLPDVLGNIKIAVEDDHQIVVDSDGVSVTGGVIEFPNVEFSLFNSVDVQATDLAIEYISGEPSTTPGGDDTPDQLLFRGSVEIMTSLFTASASFLPDPDDEDDDAFIRIQSVNNINDPFEIDVVGELAMANVMIGPFELKEAKLVIDTTQNLIGGEATLKFPTGFDIIAGVEFIDGELNMVSLGVDNINKPIGMTGAFLQKIFGSVDHLADPDPITVTGSVGVTGGPQINVPFPDFLGGSVQGSLIRIDGAMTFNSQMVKGDITAKVLGGLANGNLSAELNWGRGFLLLDGSLGVFDNAFTISGKLRADTDFNISASLIASGTIPEAVPIAGGYELPQAGAVLAISNNGFAGDDYVAVFGSIDTLFGELQGGLRVFLDGDWEFIGGDTIDALTGSSLALAMDTRRQQLAFGVGALDLDGPDAESATFTIEAGRPWAMFAAEWPNAAPGTEIELISPSGQSFTEAQIAADPDMAVEAELSGDDRRVASVLNPEPGIWTIGIADASGLGDVAFDAISGNEPPAVAVTAPASDLQTATVAIDFEAFDADDQALVDLYVDSDRQDNDGVLVANDLLEQDGPGQFILDTSTLPPGEYFAYAIVDDGVNEPVISNYSAGAFTVVDDDAPDPVDDLAARWIGDNQVQLSWTSVPDADYYEVAISPDAAGESIQQTIATVDNLDSITLNDASLETPLVEGETYRFEVRAMNELEDGDVLRGAAGEPAIGVVGPAPALAPEPGQFPVFADPDTQYIATFPFDDGAGESIALIQGPAGANLDTDSGQFTFDVPPDADGFFDIIVELTDAGGDTAQTRYQILADPDRTADLSGRKVDDADRDGNADPGETGVNGITIELLDAVTGDVLDSTITADVDLDDSGDIDPAAETGVYRFDELTPGDYLVREVFDAPNAQFFAPNPLQLDAALFAGQNIVVDFGAPSQGAISGAVLVDTDFDGVGDQPRAGVRVFLDLNANGEFDPAVDRAAVSAEDDPDTPGVDETGLYAFDLLLSQTFVVRAQPPENFSIVDPDNPDNHTIALGVDADETERDFVLALDPGDPDADKPALLLIDPVDDAVFDDFFAFDQTLADGPGGQSQSLNLALENLGGRNLVIDALLLDDPAGAFSISGLNAPTTILPQGFQPASSTTPFSIDFNPSSHGPIEASLTIQSNDPAGDRVLRLIGEGQNPDGELTVTIPTNNAGGVNVGQSASRPAFLTLANDGAADLTITSITADGIASVTGLPGDFPANPIVLAPGETQTLDAEFDVEGLGLQRGSITVLSDDDDEGSFVQPVAATGLPAVPVVNADGETLAAGPSQSDSESIFITNKPKQVVTAVKLSLDVDIPLKLGARFTLSHAQHTVTFDLQDIDDISNAVFNFVGSFDGAPAAGLWTLRADNLFDVPDDPDAVADAALFADWSIEIQTDTLDYGNDFVAVQTPAVDNSPIFRDISSGGGAFEFFLPADELFQAAAFDPVSGKIAHFTGVTGDSGQDTRVPPMFFDVSNAFDTDGDGIPDDIEQTIGTNSLAVDTDGDLIDDFAEIRQGLDPLGGLGLPIGVASRVDLAGDALDVDVAGDTENPERQFAFVATADHGLAVVDVSQKTMPVIEGELDLPGTNDAVAVDLTRGVAAVAAGSDGLHLVDVSNLMTPSLRQTVDLDHGAGRLATFDGAAYVASGSAVVAVDLLTGEILQSLDLQNGNINDIAREGPRLFTVDDQRELSIIDLTVDGMVQRGSNTLDGSDGNRGRIFVGDGLALVTVTDGFGEGFRGAFMTVDVSDPDSPVTLSGSDAGPQETLPNTEVVANGSGLAIAVGTPFATNNHQLRPFDISDPLDTNAPVAAPILLDAAPEGLDVAAGFGFVANGADGLAIVNYLQLDTLGAPPVLAIDTPLEDADPLGDGFQVLEGTSIPIDLDVDDDVQVRNIELIVNGELIVNDLSFPYDLRALAEGADGGDVVTVRVRAVDTGGNEALSNTLTFQTTPDLAPPSLVSTNVDSGTVGAAFRAVRVRFDEPIDPDTVNPANFSLRTVDGQEITPTDLQLRSNDQIVQITYPTLAKVQHLFEIDATQVADRAGNALGAAPIVKGFEIAVVEGPLFPAQKFPAAQGAVDGETADLDGDGNLDLVTANSFNDSISVFFGRGDGTLRDALNIDVADQPVAVDFGDFDADGQLDIALVLEVDDRLALFFNNGDRSFAEPVFYRVGDQPVDLQPHDVNDDGHLDLIVANRAADNLSVLLNNGDGTFPARGDAGVDLDQATIAADLNNDGVDDLVTPDTADDALLVSLGDAAGGFESARRFLVDSADPLEIAALDLDGDGNLDLLSANGADDVSVLLGRGDGTFIAAEKLDAGQGNAAAHADLNNDGAVDLAVVSEFDDAVLVFLNNGDGTFDEPLETFAGDSPQDIHAEDLDNDGIIDLAVANSASTNILVLAGLGDGTFQTPDVVTDDGAGLAGLAADLNNDGLPDFVSTQVNDNELRIALGNGDGTFTEGQAFPFDNEPDAVRAADFNGDGDVDLLAFEAGADEIFLLRGNGDGTFAEPQPLFATDDIADFAVDDVDNDGDADLLVLAGGFSSGSLLIMLGDGDGSFADPLGADVPNEPLRLRLTDVDNDGNLDAVVAAGQFFAEVATLLGNGDGTFGETLSTSTGLDANGLDVGDIDNDGQTDAVAVSSSGEFSVLLGNGDGTYSEQAQGDLIGFTHDVALGDLDNDGNLDLLFGEPSGDRLFVRTGNGDGTFNNDGQYGVGFFAGQLTLVDFNGDGNLDVASGGTAVLGNGDGSLFAPRSIPLGGNGRLLTTGDFNNDGRRDLLAGVFNGFSVALGQAGGGYADPLNDFANGEPSPGLAAAPLDADDFDDIVFARPSDGLLTVLISNGDGTFAAPQTFDSSLPQGDGLAVGDLDNDGILDLVVNYDGNFSGDNGATVVMLGDGAGGFNAPLDLRDVGLRSTPQLRDLDGDGNLDLVASGKESLEMMVQLGQGDGSFAEPLPFGVGGAAPIDRIDLADFDGDGDLDAVQAQQSIGGGAWLSRGDGLGGFDLPDRFAAGVDINSNPGQLLTGQFIGGPDVDLLLAGAAVMQGNGDGSFRAPDFFPIQGLSVARTGDLDGDGNPDLVATLPSDDDILVRLGDGQGGFGEGRRFDVDDFPTMLRLADVDDDGNLDALTGNTGFAGNSVSILLGDGAGGFGPAADLDLGSTPNDVVVDDLDGDGNLDLAVTMAQVDRVAVLLGDGAGGFGPAAEFITPDAPDELAAADVDNDGNLDLAVTAINDDIAAVLRGNGDGTFEQAGVFDDDNAVEFVAVADLNDDGDLDVVTVDDDTSSDQVRVRLGNGDGTFADPTLHSVGSRPEAVAIGDLDDDGNLDLVTADATPDTISILLGDGAGGFGPADSHAVGNNPVDLRLADLDDDGNLDVVTANQSGDNLSVALGNGDGTFAAAVDFDAGNGALRVRVADLDADGNLDLVASNDFSDDLSVLLGDGTGAFAAAVDFDANDGPNGLALGDVDEDGDLDAVTVNDNNDTANILLGDGDGAFAAPTSFPITGAPKDVRLLDVNNDAHLDIAYATDDFSDTGVNVLLGNGDGTFGDVLRFDAGPAPLALAVGDVDGDGDDDLLTEDAVLLNNPADLLVAARRTADDFSSPADLAFLDADEDGTLDLAITDETEHFVAVLIGRGDGFFDAPTTFDTGRGPREILPADLDGDGHVDLAIEQRDFSGADGVAVLLGAGDGSFGEVRRYATGRDTASVDGDDIDGDGNLDLILANSSSAALTVVRGEGDGRFAAPLLIDEPLGARAAGDLDGDGNLDLVDTNNFPDGIDIRPGNGDGTFGPPSSISLPEQPDDVRPVDFDGDGDLDLVFTQDARFTSRSFSPVGVALGNGDGTFAAPQTFDAGLDPVSLQVADLNQDGDLDVVTANEGGDDVAVLLGNGDGTLGDPTAFAALDRPASIVVADVDDDGDLDLIVSSSNTQETNALLLGNGDGTFDAPLNLHAGDAPLVLALGDLDGDGTDDLAVGLATGGFGSGTIASLLGVPGAGLFADPLLGSASIRRADDLKLVDIDGDNALDAVTAHDSGNSVFVVRGLGDGAFETNPDEIDAGADPRTVDVADLDGDGILDFIVGHDAFGADAVGFIKGLANGFADIELFPGVTGEGPVDALVRDLNDDGNPDVIAVSDDSGDVTVLLGGGGDPLALPSTFPDETSDVLGLQVVDVNSDGVLDIVTGLDSNDSIHVLLGNGDGTYVDAGSSAAGQQPFNLVVRDVDGDGARDAVVTRSDGIALLLGNDDGTFAAPINVEVAGANDEDLDAADLNGDGEVDLVIANGFNDTLTVLFNDGAGGFGQPVPITGGSGSLTLALDADNDGDPDIATLENSFGAGVVHLSLANGDGTYADPAEITTGGSPTTFVAGDFNEDGADDLAVLVGSEDEIEVFLSHGDGSFADPIVYEVGGGPADLVAGDVDGDGRLDLATANSLNTGTNSVLFGNGDGTFVAPLKMTFDREGRGSDAADFNGDGRLDVVTANTFADDVSISLGNGDGTFAPPTHIDLGNFNEDVVAADFNNDGDVDIAVTAGSNAQLVLALGNGDGTFAAPASFNTEFGPNGLVAADLDNDGNLDAVVANQSSNSISILLGNGDGTFAAAVHRSAGFSPQALEATDLDGDGDVDLAVAAGNSDDVLVFVNNGDGTFPGPVAVDVADNPTDIDVADLNGDGNPDIAVASPGFGSANVTVLFGSADATTYTRADFAVNALASASAMALTDADGDGNIDVVVASLNSGLAVVMPGDGDGGFGDPIGLFDPGARPEIITVADFNEDGDDDLLISDVIVTGNGDGTYNAPAPMASGFLSSGGNTVGLGDVDADGDIDVLASSNSGAEIVVLRGNGDRTFQPGEQLADLSGVIGFNNTDLAAVADFTGDGADELIVRVAPGDRGVQFGIMVNNGDGTYADPVSLNLDHDPTADATVADLNGDGALDLVFGSASQRTIALLLGDGAGGFSAPMRFGFSPDDFAAVRSAAVADADGDGNLDLLTRAGVVLGNGDGSFQAPVELFINDGVAAVDAAADLDADGHVDLVSVSESFGEFYVSYGLGGGLFESPLAFDAGGSPHRVAVGDLDGDGLLDVVIGNEEDFFEETPDAVRTFVNNGDRTFAANDPVTVEDRIVDLALGDVTGDGLLDVVAQTSPAGAQVELLIGNGDGTLLDPFLYGINQTRFGNDSRGGVEIADANSDGFPDIIAGDSAGVTILFNFGDAFAASQLGGGQPPLQVLAPAAAPTSDPLDHPLLPAPVDPDPSRAGDRSREAEPGGLIDLLTGGAAADWPTDVDPADDPLASLI